MGGIPCWSRLLLVALLLWSSSRQGATLSTGSLCSAVSSGKLAQVQGVLKTGANPSLACDPNTNASFPLHIAASKNLLDIGRLLISKGANVDQTALFGYTPLLRSAENLYVDFMRLLLQNKADVKSRLLAPLGLKLQLGLDLLSLGTAAYLRKYPFSTKQQKDELTKRYLGMADLLFSYCFDFKNDAGMARTRLRSENHLAESKYIDALITKDEQGLRQC